MSHKDNTLELDEIKEKKRAYHREYSRKYRKANLERCREINRKAVAKFRKDNPEQYYKIQRKYDVANREKRVVKVRRYQAKFPKKILAQKLVNQAIQRGEIVRQPCQCCGKPKAEAHHADYSKPFEVQWLCRKHHAAWHKLFKAVEGE